MKKKMKNEFCRKIIFSPNSTELHITLDYCQYCGNTKCGHCAAGDAVPGCGYQKCNKLYDFRGGIIVQFLISANCPYFFMQK